MATLTVPKRALILAETLERPISPSQFAKEWGLEETATTGIFYRMEKDGFLEKADKARPRPADDGSSRGRPVQRYRATQNLLYRTEEWQHLPQEVREGHSFVVFITLMSRISLSINTGTLDRDLDRHFTWKALVLDRATWDELILRLDELLDWIIDAEKKARARMERSGEQPIPATIALLGGRSPGMDDLRSETRAVFEDQLRQNAGISQNAALRRATAAMGQNAPSLSIPERALILAETLERPLSPSQFAYEWGFPKETTARHFRILEKAGFLVKAGTGPAKPADDGSSRGHDVQLYSATQNLLYRTEEWQHLPQEVREGHSFVVFITLMSRISLSINARTLDRDLDRHFTWKALEIDQATWDELILRLDKVLDWIIDAEKEAKGRIESSGEEQISATVALLGGRSPSRSELLKQALVD
jgi:hypothetical protein